MKMVPFFQTVQRCYKRKKKIAIILPNFQISSGHNGRPILASEQVQGSVLHQICCSLCLIKIETLAEKADAIGQFR